MLSKDTIIEVINRDSGTVGYEIPDLNNLRRSFEPGEKKEIPLEELKKLVYVPGGEYIIKNCLLIRDEEAVAEILGDVEPEYFYTKDRIKDLMLNGSLDEFLDCLDFAPIGVIEIIKNLAVDLKLNDIAKRKAILEKTGFNVTKAIEINEECDADDEDTPVTTQRRAPVPTTSTTTGRRTEPPKYNVVHKA